MVTWTKLGGYSHKLMWRVAGVAWLVRTYQHGHLLRADVAVVDDYGDLVEVLS